MTINERVKCIRKHYNLTMEKFGEHFGITKTAISLIESGKNSVTDANIKSICREFNVNEHWLRTGEGEMFLLPEDEEAAYVADLLMETDNEFYDLIISIMKTYSEFGEKEKDVLKSFAKNLKNNLNKKDRD